MLCRRSDGRFPGFRRNPGRRRHAAARPEPEGSGFWGTGGRRRGPGRSPGAGPRASGARVGEVAVRRGRQAEAEVQKPVEGGPPVAAVPSEDKLVQVALGALPAQPVVHAHGPAPEVGEHPVDPPQDLVGRAAADHPAPARAVRQHPCWKSSPDPAFFRLFPGFSAVPCPAVPDLSTAFPTGGGVRARRRARRGDPGRPAGDSLSVPDGRGPACRQAAAAVRSSHIRRSRRRALAVTTSLRMTATRATLWGFPLSRSRWYSSLMSGEHLLADSAAI